MIRSALDFGAPLTDPGGNVAAKIAAHPTSGLEPADDGRDEMDEAGVGLDPAQRRDLDRSRLADPAEVVADEVDDHDVLVASPCPAGPPARDRCP